MTGFGRSEVALNDKNVIVEIRSLNGKLADLRIKTQLQLGQFELELRKLVMESAVRGKLDMSIEIKGAGALEAGLPNTDLIKTYFLRLREVSAELGVDDDKLYSTVLRLPNIFQPDNGELDEELREAITKGAKGALELLKEFRAKEGQGLYTDLKQRVLNIDGLLSEVDPHEADRKAALKERLEQKISEIERESLDQNRFEQEILYYLDKLDINAFYLTHFGVINKTKEHIKGLREVLFSWSEWIRPYAEKQTDWRSIIPGFEIFVTKERKKAGVAEESIKKYGNANPTWMSIAGLMRYWRKKLEIE